MNARRSMWAAIVPLAVLGGVAAHQLSPSKVLYPASTASYLGTGGI